MSAKIDMNITEGDEDLVNVVAPLVE